MRYKQLLFCWLMILLDFVFSTNRVVKVNFVQNQKGKWMSILNLRASFPDPDTVDVEPPSISAPSVDFDLIDDGGKPDDEVTIIYVTPMPLLETISAPERPVVRPQGVIDYTTPKPTTFMPRISDERFLPQPDESTPPALKPTPSSLKDDGSIEYAVNDFIPGILDLGSIIIPHKIRHSHGKHTTSKGPPTVLSEDVKPTESEWDLARSSTVRPHGAYPIDDEDYNNGWSTNAFSTTENTLIDTEVNEEATVSSTPTASELSTTDMTGDEPDMYDSGYDYYGDENYTFNETNVLGSLFFTNDTAEEEEFILNAREILHGDPLGRNESVLREMLSDLKHLESDDDKTMSYRDHGASFLLPILKTVNYDNSSVPVAFSDIPLNVVVKLNIIHLANFDSEQMEYTIDLEMEMRWFDIRLANNYSKPIRVREKEILDLVFRPDPYFVNSKISYFHMVSFPNFRMRIMPSGLVIYSLRVTLVPSCSMTFCRFPHDSQMCDLLISSIAYSRSYINFVWHTEAIQFSSKISLPELRIKRLLTEECVVEGKLIASSCLRLVFALERDGARYIIEKYVPSTLAMMFAWVAPYVPYYYEDVRIVTPITVLLTLVQLEKGDKQIRTSYLTSMDMWFGAMKAFAVLSLIESLIVLALIKRSRAMEKQAHRATNEYTRESFESEKRRLTDLYHRLDTACRLLSPVVFVCYFVFYVLYIAQGDESYCLNQRVF
uniref:Neur_chan_LBD domain-containing protein n=1 Tax=Panagrellus redivivus TaxID=6233 RepID=A0A7E4UTN7_PANRE